MAEMCTCGHAKNNHDYGLAYRPAKGTQCQKCACAEYTARQQVNHFDTWYKQHAQHSDVNEYAARMGWNAAIDAAVAAGIGRTGMFTSITKLKDDTQ